MTRLGPCSALAAHLAALDITALLAVGVWNSVDSALLVASRYDEFVGGG